jgi:hypothetical protein
MHDVAQRGRSATAKGTTAKGTTRKEAGFGERILEDDSMSLDPQDRARPGKTSKTPMITDRPRLSRGGSR